jgi:hypothetical protein
MEIAVHILTPALSASKGENLERGGADYGRSEIIGHSSH